MSILRSFCIILFLSIISTSISASHFHSFVNESDITLNGEKYINSSNYKTVSIDFDALKEYLNTAPQEFTGSSIILTLPMYNGELMQFEVTESKIMEEELAAKYPHFKTYNGQGIEDPTANLKLSITHKGVHAYIRDLKGTWAIDPYHNQTTQYYLVHHKNGFITDKYATHHCSLDVSPDYDNQVRLKNTFNNAEAKLMQLPECALRTYRVAINATGEFTAFHGGTVPDALAAIVVSLNRINGVYERDAGLRMLLVNDNDQVIYTNSTTDPFSNGNAGTMIDESHNNLVSVIGSANFDIGHVFSNSGAGLANLSAACSNNNKGRGVTGVNPPVGDFFDIDYASHEFGHQWSGNHTWDYCLGGGNGGAATMEPGSASTIMGYADLCGADNLQNYSDDYFHSYNILEMTDFSQLGSGNNCAVIIPNDNNAPTADAGGDYIIPANTPFELTGNAFDPDGDVLTYCWEQFDTGTADPVNSPSVNGAIFRSWLPTIDNNRIFPRLAELLDNTTPFGESLPFATRDINFRLTVRDNYAGSGCTDFDDMVVEVDGDSGPFEVISPNGGESINAFDFYAVTWDVAGSDLAPVNCPGVDILLSLDGGLTFPIVLAGNVPNDGSFTVNIPDQQTTNARIKVQCSDNIFFDISNDEFSIIEPLAPTFVFDAFNGITSNICAGEDLNLQIDILQILGFTGIVNINTNNVPPGLTVSYNNNPASVPSTLIANITNTGSLSAGSYNFQISGISGPNTSTVDVELIIEEAAPIVTFLLDPPNGATNINPGQELVWNVNLNATLGYDIEIALDDAFTNIVESANTFDLTYIPTLAVNNFTTFYWRVKASNYCGDGPWSNISSFTTSSCSIYEATNLPDINFGTQTSNIFIVNQGTVISVEVFDLIIDHNRIGNCDISLTSPEGTTVQLFDNDCGNDDDMNLNFSDSGQSNNSIPCPPTNGNVFQPASGTFADFIGENAAGDWVLTIEDNQTQVDGSLLNWDLFICTELIGPNLLVSGDTEICEGESTVISAFGASTYIWFPSNSLSSATDAVVTAFPTETTTYTLVGTDDDNISAQYEFTIIVNPTPELTIENLPDSVFTTDIVELIGTPPGGTFYGPGVVGNFLEPYYSNSGWVDIVYFYTDDNGCSANINQSIYIGIMTDIDPVNKINDFELKLLKNDAELVVNKAGIYETSVYNLNGGLIHFNSKYYNNGNNLLNLDQLRIAKGIYVLDVNHEGIHRSLKFYKL